jgi:2-polyprenyl-3-methyl-5-hydroxy-6-metoxy-1,4-benzoquinol methylase
MRPSRTFYSVYNLAMSILLDPEGNETRAFFSLFNNFAGRSVLEIGCGDGRLTWRYAERAQRVTAIDLEARKINEALANQSPKFQHVQFLNTGLEPFAVQSKEKFDIAILAWSL